MSGGGGGGGGGGGNTKISSIKGGFRSPSNEKQTIGNWYDFQNQQYGDFFNSNPLLSQAQSQALDYNQNQLPGMLSQFGGFQGQLNDIFNQIGGFSGELGGYKDQLGGLVPGIQGNQAELRGLDTNLGGQQAQINNWLGQVNPTIMDHGQLSPELLRNADQGLDVSNTGFMGTTGDFANKLLNRQSLSDARFNTALQQGQSLESQQGQLTDERGRLVGQQSGLSQLLSGIFGQQAGITGQQAGLSGAQAGITGENAGLLGQLQGLQTGGLNQLLGLGNAAVGQFSQLMMPAMDYLGNLYSGNQQAAVNQAQINSQANLASNASKGSTTGGAISGVGSIIGAVLPLLASSDERIKTKIKSTGMRTSDDIPIKTFEYLTNPGKRYAGVMAQDVEKSKPQSVFIDPMSGLKMVGLEFAPVPVKEG